MNDQLTAESADPGWSPVATTIACDWCGECEWCLNYYPPEPPLPEPEYVHCTCGHPNDDHSALGECPFPGCGCGRLDPSKDPTPPGNPDSHEWLGMER